MAFLLSLLFFSILPISFNPFHLFFSGPSIFLTSFTSLQPLFFLSSQFSSSPLLFSVLFLFFPEPSMFFSFEFIPVIFMPYRLFRSSLFLSCIHVFMRQELLRDLLKSVYVFLCSPCFCLWFSLFIFGNLLVFPLSHSLPPLYHF